MPMAMDWGRLCAHPGDNVIATAGQLEMSVMGSRRATAVEKRMSTEVLPHACRGKDESKLVGGIWDGRVKDPPTMQRMVSSHGLVEQADP
jgi:hypothetical protein